jgi:hypothetical protein
MEKWQPDALGKLFKDELKKRFQWAQRKKQHLRELSLAREYLKRNDYLRAVIYALEGLISERLYQEKIATDDFAERHEVSQQLAEIKSYRTLRDIRNRLAHGSSSTQNEKNPDVKKALRSSKDMCSVLNRLFNDLNVR